ncbi:MAG TPA: L,D-transpeptidase [Solirubrobacteraceae bacterium]
MTYTTSNPVAGSAYRRRGWRRLGRFARLALAAVCLAGVTSTTTANSALGAGSPKRVQATTELVALLAPQVAHQAPDVGSPSVAPVADRRPITGEQTTLPVLSRVIGAGGAQWLRVMLPGRPDGLTGWISQSGTRLLVTPWRIVVDLAARRVKAYRDGMLAGDFTAVVGKPSTPTPTGEFFVEEVLRMTPSETGGPFALALSARSNVLQEFEGGPGQIAIHGRENLGGTLGTAASHGCVRLATASIDWLSTRIVPGTPVTIDEG